MKKTQWIDLFETIKKNIIPFIASIFFVSFGVAFFCGMSWSGTAVYQHIDRFHKEGNLHHFDISFLHGIKEDEMNQLLELDFVDEVEGYHASYQFMILNDNKLQTFVMELTQHIDKPITIEGTLPKEENEIAVEGVWAEKNGIDIGDTIHFISDMPQQEQKEFIVTALIENSVYISTSEDSYGVSPLTEIPINCVMFVAPSSNTYSHVLISCNELKEFSVFDDEYWDKEKNIKAELTEKVEELFPNTQYIISGVDHMPSYHLVEATANTFFRSRFAVAGVFAVVGFLVCYSTLSRTVHNDTISIGTKKAFGFSQKEIWRFYRIYSGIIVLLGCIIGLLLGLFFVETLILTGIKTSYVFQNMKLYFGGTEAILLSLLEFIFVMLVTRLAVGTILKQNAIDLLADMRTTMGKKHFYETFALYKKLPLFTQIILNNCFHDTRRVIGMIIGVIGCSSLVVTPFVYKNLTLNNYELQYTNSYFFDYIIYYNHYEKDAEEQIATLLDEKGLSHTKILYRNLFISTPDDEQSSAILFVPSDVDSYKQFVKPEPDVKDKDSVSVYEGIWLSRAFRDEHDLYHIDSHESTTLSGKTTHLDLDGHINHYLNNIQIYMDKDTYQSLFEEEPAYNAFLIDSNGMNMDSLSRLLLEINGFFSLKNYAQSTWAMFELIETVSGVIIIVYLSLAMAMAILVLLNLMMLYVQEKKKELIILMINGYPLKYVRRYIYSDTIVITIVGIIIGVGLGEILGNVAMSAFEHATLFYPFTIDITAAIIGVAVTTILSFIMSYLSLRQINKFELSDLNR